MVLADLAQLAAVGFGTPLIDPQFLGYQFREDGWHDPQWNRGGDWFVIYSVEKGWVRAELGEQCAQIGPGQSLFMPYDQRPSLTMSKPLEYRELWFSFSEGGLSPKLTQSDGSLDAFTTPREVDPLIDLLAADRLLCDKNDLSPLMRYRLCLLLELCDLSLQREKEQGSWLQPCQQSHLVKWVRKNMAERPSPKECAQELGISYDYFGRLFKKTFDMSTRDWLVQERITMARRLLDEGELHTTEVMARCGFDNLAHFSRQLKKMTGKTPGGKAGWNQLKGMPV